MSPGPQKRLTLFQKAKASLGALRSASNFVTASYKFFNFAVKTPFIRRRRSFFRLVSMYVLMPSFRIGFGLMHKRAKAHSSPDSSTLPTVLTTQHEIFSPEEKASLQSRKEAVASIEPVKLSDDYAFIKRALPINPTAVSEKIRFPESKKEMLQLIQKTSEKILSALEKGKPFIENEAILIPDILTVHSTLKKIISNNKQTLSLLLQYRKILQLPLERIAGNLQCSLLILKPIISRDPESQYALLRPTIVNTLDELKKNTPILLEAMALCSGIDEEQADLQDSDVKTAMIPISRRAVEEELNKLALSIEVTENDWRLGKIVSDLQHSFKTVPHPQGYPAAFLSLQGAKSSLGSLHDRSKKLTYLLQYSSSLHKNLSEIALQCLLTGGNIQMYSSKAHTSEPELELLLDNYKALLSVAVHVASAGKSTTDTAQTPQHIKYLQPVQLLDALLCVDIDNAKNVEEKTEKISVAILCLLEILEKIRISSSKKDLYSYLPSQNHVTRVFEILEEPLTLHTEIKDIVSGITPTIIQLIGYMSLVFSTGLTSHGSYNSGVLRVPALLRETFLLTRKRQEVERRSHFSLRFGDTEELEHMGTCSQEQASAKEQRGASYSAQHISNTDIGTSDREFQILSMVSKLAAMVEEESCDVRHSVSDKDRLMSCGKVFDEALVAPNILKAVRAPVFESALNRVESILYPYNNKSISDRRDTPPAEKDVAYLIGVIREQCRLSKGETKGRKVRKVRFVSSANFQLEKDVICLLNAINEQFHSMKHHLKDSVFYDLLSEVGFVHTERGSVSFSSLIKELQNARAASRDLLLSQTGKFIVMCVAILHLEALPNRCKEFRKLYELSVSLMRLLEPYSDSVLLENIEIGEIAGKLLRANMSLVTSSATTADVRNIHAQMLIEGVIAKLAVNAHNVSYKKAFDTISKARVIVGEVSTSSTAYVLLDECTQDMQNLSKLAQDSFGNKAKNNPYLIGSQHSGDIYEDMILYLIEGCSVVSPEEYSSKPLEALLKLLEAHSSSLVLSESEDTEHEEHVATPKNLVEGSSLGALSINPQSWNSMDIASNMLSIATLIMRDGSRFLSNEKDIELVTDYIRCLIKVKEKEESAQQKNTFPIMVLDTVISSLDKECAERSKALGDAANRYFLSGKVLDALAPSLRKEDADNSHKLRNALSSFVSGGIDDPDFEESKTSVALLNLDSEEGNLPDEIEIGPIFPSLSPISHSIFFQRNLNGLFLNIEKVQDFLEDFNSSIINELSTRGVEEDATHEFYSRRVEKVIRSLSTTLYDLKTGSELYAKSRNVLHALDELLSTLKASFSKGSHTMSLADARYVMSSIFEIRSAIGSSVDCDYSINDIERSTYDGAITFLRSLSSMLKNAIAEAKNANPHKPEREVFLNCHEGAHYVQSAKNAIENTDALVELHLEDVLKESVRRLERCFVHLARVRLYKLPPSFSCLRTLLKSASSLLMSDIGWICGSRTDGFKIRKEADNVCVLRRMSGILSNSFTSIDSGTDESDGRRIVISEDGIVILNDAKKHLNEALHYLDYTDTNSEFIPAYSMASMAHKSLSTYIARLHDFLSSLPEDAPKEVSDSEMHARVSIIAARTLQGILKIQGHIVVEQINSQDDEEEIAALERISPPLRELYILNMYDAATRIKYASRVLQSHDLGILLQRVWASVEHSIDLCIKFDVDVHDPQEIHSALQEGVLPKINFILNRLAAERDIVNREKFDSASSNLTNASKLIERTLCNLEDGKKRERNKEEVWDPNIPSVHTEIYVPLEVSPKTSYKAKSTRTASSSDVSGMLEQLVKKLLPRALFKRPNTRVCMERCNDLITDITQGINAVEEYLSYYSTDQELYSRVRGALRALEKSSTYLGRLAGKTPNVEDLFDSACCLALHSNVVISSTLEWLSKMKSGTEEITSSLSDILNKSKSLSNELQKAARSREVVKNSAQRRPLYRPEVGENCVSSEIAYLALSAICCNGTNSTKEILSTIKSIASFYPGNTYVSLDSHFLGTLFLRDDMDSINALCNNCIVYTGTGASGLQEVLDLFAVNIRHMDIKSGTRAASMLKILIERSCQEVVIDKNSKRKGYSLMQCDVSEIMRSLQDVNDTEIIDFLLNKCCNGIVGKEMLVRLSSDPTYSEVLDGYGGDSHGRMHSVVDSAIPRCIRSSLGVADALERRSRCGRIYYGSSTIRKNKPTAPSLRKDTGKVRKFSRCFKFDECPSSGDEIARLSKKKSSSLNDSHKNASYLTKSTKTPGSVVQALSCHPANHRDWDVHNILYK